MDPLNKKERNKKLFQFLAIFIAGILITLIPFYFIVRLPAKEKAVKNEEFSSLEGQLKFQKDYFSVMIDSATRLIARFDQPGIDIDKLNPAIGDVLNDMEKSIGTSDSWSTTMYKQIIDLLGQMKKARNDQIKSKLDMARANSDLADCQKELEKCTKNLKEAEGGGKKSKDSLEH